MIGAGPACHSVADPDPDLASCYLSVLWIRIRSDPKLDQVYYRYGPGSESPLMYVFCTRQCFWGGFVSVSDPYSLSPDLDPAFRLNTDPELGFADQKLEKIYI
jgi:hypothetical protein